MHFAPERDWEYFATLKREQLRKKMIASTPEERLDQYADIFESVVEFRSHTGIDYRVAQRWEEKLELRNRLVEKYIKTESSRLGYST